MKTDDTQATLAALQARAGAGMSFEDVRSGDMITVEVRPKNNPPYRVMGTALVEGERISIPGAAFQVYKFAGAWVECDITRPATLIAHTHTEPA